MVGFTAKKGIETFRVSVDQGEVVLVSELGLDDPQYKKHRTMLGSAPCW